MEQQQDDKYQAKYLPGDGNFSTHPLKRLRQAKDNKDIINLHALRDSRVGDIQDDSDIRTEEKLRLNEKLSVKVEKQPLFPTVEEESKDVPKESVTEEDNFFPEKVQIVERDIIIGVSAPVGEDNCQPKKKKKSIFAQMMSQKKQEDSGNPPKIEEKINFPKAEKINLRQEVKVEEKVLDKPKKEKNTAFPQWWNGTAIKEEYKSDLNTISSENTQKIGNMSQDQIQNAVADIYKNFSPEVIQAFRAMAQAQAKPKESVKIEFEEDSESKIPEEVKAQPNPVPIHTPVSKPSNSTPSPVAQAEPPIVQQPPICEAFSAEISQKEVFIKRNGEYKLGSKENLESESLLISDILNITEDTNLNLKYFSTNDLVFLLHSSYVPHRLLALSIASKFVEVNIAQGQLIKSVLLDKDILGAGFTVLYNSPGITPVFQLKLFGLLHSLIQIVYPVQDDRFEVIQITNSDLNTQGNIWVSSLTGESIESVTELHTEIINKYELVISMTSFLVSHEKLDFTIQCADSDLCRLFVKILSKIITTSKEEIQTLIKKELLVGLCKVLLLNEELQLLQVICKASRSASSILSTVCDSMKVAKEDVESLPSSVIKMLNCFSTTDELEKINLLNKLRLCYLLKVNGKWKKIFNVQNCLFETVEFFKLINNVLQYNTVDNNKSSLPKFNEICSDKLLLQIISQTIALIQFDKFQNCKDWSEDKVKRNYAQIDTMLMKVYEALISNTTYIGHITSSEELVYHLSIFSLLLSTAKASYSEKTLDLVESLLSQREEPEVKKACLYLLRQTMSRDVTCLVKSYSIYQAFYTHISTDTLDEKFYWYPLKVVIFNLLQNFDTIQKQESNCSELELCSKLMKLLIPRDEYALMEVVSIIFKDNETLKVFFYGYCINNDVATNVSKPFYDTSEPASNIGFGGPHKNPYLPLDTNWFVKPIMFSKKANLCGENSKDSQLHSLAYLFQEILSKLVEVHVTNPDDLQKTIFGDLSSCDLISLSLSFISHAHLQNNSKLITQRTVTYSMQMLELFKSSEVADKQKEVTEVVELACQFLNEFGFCEDGSEFVTRGLLLLGEKCMCMDRIKEELKEIWHCVQEALQDYDSSSS